VPWRDRSEERPTGLVRVVPDKSTVNNSHYQDLFDCETYALQNKSVSYTRAHAHTMGRLKKDVIHSFGHRSERNGDPPHRVFRFFRKFCKACDDNDVSEGEAFYMSQDLTLEPLRSEVMAVMPTRRGGNPGEVSSYLELVNWIIRMHANEPTVAGLVEQFHQARQEEKEYEMSYAERLRVLNASCGFLHSTGALKGRYVGSVHPVVRATLRERNKPGMTLAELSRIAQTRGDEYRWMKAAQQKERAEEAAKLAEATRLRRQARALVTPRYPVRLRTTRSESVGQSVATTTPPHVSGSGKAASFPCWQCNQTGHWAEECPKLDPCLRARLAQNSRWAKEKSRPARQMSTRPTGPPVVATAGGNDSSSGSESPPEKGESNPQAAKPAASSSESDEGNA